MTLRIDPPNEKQKLALLANRKHIGFGGARGGGKSHFVRTKAKLLALHYPGIKILLIRRTYPELINNHINILVSELNGIARYNKSEKVFQFGNGSIIKAGYCSGDQDLLQYQGSEWDIIFFDEATNLSEYQMKTISACLRGVNEFPKRIYYTCNPGGIGHQYIKRIFIDRQYVAGEDPNDYEFIQALVQDNYALMKIQPDYIKQLEALPPKLKEAWLNGSWDVLSGQVFSEWINDDNHYDDRKGTHVINPFRIPEDWGIWCGLDWGYSRPYAVGWYAVDHNRRMYMIRELYGCTTTANEGVKQEPSEVARMIRAIEANDINLKDRTIHRVGDPAIWASQGTESIGSLMERERVYFEKGDNSRINGKMQIHHRLAFNDSNEPMLYVFKNCENFIRTMPLLMYDEKNAEDVDTSMEDHLYDMCRYVCMKNPIAPPEKKVVIKKEYSPLDEEETMGRYDFYLR